MGEWIQVGISFLLRGVQEASPALLLSIIGGG